jgi:uncharacterized protein (TIGR01777 family)
MRILVSGASGLIGSALVPALRGDGHTVTPLVRGRDEPGAVRWDPAGGVLDPAAVEGVDAAVHLAGETIDGRWTDAKKKRIMDSRRDSTRLLAETLARLERRPQVLVSASAVGYYGNGGDQELTEESPSGEGFLAEVVRVWEEASTPAAAAGVRVANTRFGIVLSPKGGALGRMLTPFKLGLGGPFGSGRQYMSWIALDDLVGALRHVIGTEALSGPINTTAPEPVTNKDFARTLGRVLGRPALVPVPPPALRLALGQFAEEGLLFSQRAVPKRLLDSGYTFRFPQLEPALRHLLEKPAG